MIFVVLLLFPILILVTLAILMRPKSKGRRIRIVTIILVLPFLIFFTDEITGDLYLKYICEIDENMEVYNKVKLPEKYWNKKGKLIFINEKGIVDFNIFNSLFKWSFIKEPHIRGLINIDKHQSIIMDINTNKILGKKATYSRRYGWLRYNFSLAPNIGEGCNSVLIKMHGRYNYYKKRDQYKIEFISNVITR